jgi:GT2 family glycosyltransferase
MLTCAVIITTHNRREDLRRTLDVLAQLDPPADEIWIAVDGCSDGTEDFLRADYPHCRLLVHRISRGSIASRNELARAADCDLLLSLDDDSYPLEPDAIARMRDIFEKNPRLAVADFPQRSDEFPATLAEEDFGPARFAGSYSDCGCAYRRATLLELGGHFEPFWHAYEEPDFALRCAAAGWQIRFEPAITIRHHFSGVNRNEIRTHQRHARNELWSVLMRCPAPQVFAVALFRAARQLGYACSRGLDWLVREPRWWIDFLAGAPRALRARCPIPWRIYWNWMKLVRHPIFSETEWIERFGK